MLPNWLNFHFRIYTEQSRHGDTDRVVEIGTGWFILAGIAAAVAWIVF